ncbi:MAG: hypothetical protein IJZ51_09235 [Ruminiclostridium sp.]|nr:hypothetical protein [Ruminiclostridium sp.]
MKKHRCPYCGDECLTFFGRNFSSDLRSETYTEKGGSKCPSCHNYFSQYIRKNAVAIPMVILAIAWSIASFYFIFAVNKYFIILFAISIPLLVVLTAVIFNFSASLTQYDQKNREHIIPTPDKDISIILDKPGRKIKYLSIYGVRFKKKTNNVRFHETFKNDLVPVVFLNKEKTTELPIHIIKAQFVPEMLLADGTELEIIDNGKVIGTGVFSNKREQT